MRLEQVLPQRWHALTHELAKFGTIGVINLFVNFAVFNALVLTVLRDGQLKAKAIAAVVAITSAYFMNRHWTYRDRPKSTLRREYTLFFVFNLVGLIIEVAVVGLAKYGFGLTHVLVLNLCTAVGIALGTLFRFWAYRTHVFRIEPVPAVAASPTTPPRPVVVGSAVLKPISLTRIVLGRAIRPAAPRIVPPAFEPQLGSAFEDHLDSALSDELADEIELDGIVALSEQPVRSQSYPSG